MSLVKKYNEIISEINTKVDTIYNTEMETVKTFLKATEIDKHRAISNNEDENRILSLYDFKEKSLDILTIMIESHILNFDTDLISLVGDLIINDIPNLSGEGSVLLDEIIKKIYKKCFYILYHIGDINNLPKVKAFIEKQDIPDFRNVCLAILFKVDSWSAFDLECLSNLSSPAIIYDLVRMYKDDLIKELRYKLVKDLSVMFKENNSDLKHIYLIFYEINEFLFNELITKPVDGEFSNEFFKFIYSLIINSVTSMKAFNFMISSGIFDDLRDGISDIIKMNVVENRAVDPQDEEFVLHLIEIISKILSFMNKDMEYIRLYFGRFIDPIMRYITGGVGLKTRGSVYSFLDKYLNDEEIKICILEYFRASKVFKRENFIRDVEEEIIEGTFFFTPRALKLMSYLDLDLGVDCALYALRTEDVNTIRIAFDLFFKSEKVSSKSILLSSKHIRMAMLSSSSLTRYITRYQIENEIILNDVGMISVIVATSNPDFFSYVSLFENFSLFFNGKFLDQITEDKEEGLNYLINATKKDTTICKFIGTNIDYFNSLMEDFPNLSSKLCHIYDNLMDFDVENIEVSFKDGFILREEASPHLFTILSKKLAFSYLTENNIYQKYITNKTFVLSEDCIQSYILYLKTRIMIGDKVDGLISDFISRYDNTEDLLRYYKIVTGSNLNELGENIVDCFDKKDNNSFVKLYPKASSLEKFLLYFTITSDTINSNNDFIMNEIKNIIKDEVTRITLIKNIGVEDKMILRQCIYSLLRMNNIDSIVRIINDFDDIDLLLKLNLRNITTGGMYFNPQIVMKGSVELQISSVFVLYYNNIWDHSLLKDWIVHLYKENRSNRDLEYLVNDINKKNEYGFEIQLL